MKESFWGYFIIILGIFVITIMIITQNLTTTSEEDYYLTKEVMEAAMIDSIDYGLYRQTGEIRIIQSKFVENFTRRFADSVNSNKTYKIDFYEIYENPPKATVRIKTNTGNYKVSTDTTNFDILTTLSGILETKYSNSNVKTYDVNLTLKSDIDYFNGRNYHQSVSQNGNAIFSNIKLQYGTDKYSFSNLECNGSPRTLSKDSIEIKNVTSDLNCSVEIK